MSLDDWRQAQILAGTLNYFNVSATVKGHIIIMATAAFGALSKKGANRASKAQMTKDAKPAMQAYCKFVAKDPSADFDTVIENMSFNQLRKYYSVLIELCARGFPRDAFCSHDTQAFNCHTSSTLSACYHLMRCVNKAGKGSPFGNEVLYQCSCPQFWHYAKCKHSLGYAIFKGEIKVPTIYCIELIGAARTAGRPANAHGGDALRKP